ncbi:DUF2463 domain-containing protein [Encephalitozoon hellem]|uniref:DUF2463 domain-containing protein n=1 Tax=Encephalitozoon hellem TaxID=27973 RepID=A0A9Q9C4A7_ENCHE|nr:DUF2463 domain-containing protein [Encephalitozoon hellem]UTX43464.1 DUF2463 domain-containing protein [Encephalitozoon hellem]UTX43889.1 DUF2463 domain-containing protein [Encephalitozoon hellem]UTX44071.1 DUF2463 domain-containing protein [Encephalitozoon hellem]UTX44270.1 DUF2463 domain-containing protein [Encephalitozoon hellem]
MNVSINLPQLDQTDEHAKEHRAGPSWKDIIQICAAPISMVFPIITYLLLDEDTIRYNILLKLAIVLPPFLYSGVHCLIMFNNNRTEQSKPLSTPRPPLVFLLNTLLLLFSIISLISIIAFPIDEWGKDYTIFLSIILPSFFVSSTYLLSTSCTLTRSSLQYTTTNTIDILLDLLILLSILASIAAGIALDINIWAWTFCFIILPVILIFIRSWREKYLPSAKYEGSVVASRVAIPLIIFLISIVIYSLLTHLLLLIFKEKLKSPEHY